jgi:hypothetical protein
MNHVEINKKMLPNCLWLKGYLTDHKWKPDQYKSSGKFKACRTKFVDPLSWKFLAYAWGVSKNRCTTVLASLNTLAKAQGTSLVPGTNVIDCARTASIHYTPEFMFVQCRVIKMKGKTENLAYDNLMSQNCDLRKNAKLE